MSFRNHQKKICHCRTLPKKILQWNVSSSELKFSSFITNGVIIVLIKLFVCKRKQFCHVTIMKCNVTNIIIYHVSLALKHKQVCVQFYLCLLPVLRTNALKFNASLWEHVIHVCNIFVETSLYFYFIYLDCIL